MPKDILTDIFFEDEYFIDKRYQSFMRRLVQRQHRVAREETKIKNTGEGTSTWREEHQDRLTWKMPSTTTMDLDQPNSLLRIRVQAIRSDKKDLTRVTGGNSSNQQGSLLKLKADIGFTISDPLSEYKCKGAYERNARISAWQSDSGREAILTCKEVIVQEQDFRLPPEARENGQSGVHADAYSLEISINFLTEGDGVTLHDDMGANLSKTDARKHTERSPNRWRAQYSNIRTAPETPILLPLGK